MKYIKVSCMNNPYQPLTLEWFAYEKGVADVILKIVKKRYAR